MKKALVFSQTVAPVEMAELPRDANLSEMCIATGFGKLAQNKENESRRLMKVALEVVPT